MTLPRPESVHRWQGRMLVDGDGEVVGSIQTIYLDRATAQPEWALLQPGTARPAPTFASLAGASEEGDTIRVPFAKTLVDEAPTVPEGRALSEDQEEALYRHYGVPYSRAQSPSGLPAGTARPASRSLPAGIGAAIGTLAVAVGFWRREAIGRQVGTAISRAGAIPRASRMRRRRRRRAEAINQSVARVATQTTVVARTAARLLAAVALLPVVSAARGAQRTRAGIQATGATIKRRAPRLRPARRKRAPRLRSARRKRRRGAFGMLLGGAAGYVLGSRAGEQAYQKITETAQQLTERPEVKRASEQGLAKLNQLSGQAADKLRQARQSSLNEAGAGSPQLPRMPTD